VSSDGDGWNFLTYLDPAAMRPISIVGRVIIPWQEEARVLLFEIALEHGEAGGVNERVPVG
jgi:hypothetical protein